MKKKIIIISSIVVILDQLLKLLVRNSLMGIEKDIIPGFFYLTGVKNTGGAFSILSNNTVLLAIIGIIVLIGIIYYLNKKEINNNFEMIAYSILIGGIIGNFIDRIVFSGVYDYIGLIFGSYYYPVFNLADIGIVIGIIMLIIIEIRGEKHGTSSN